MNGSLVVHSREVLSKVAAQWRIHQTHEKQLRLAEVWGPLSDIRGVSSLLTPSILSNVLILFPLQR